ncbi:tRNA (mnm(5)s(2)U34)-methyltransferase, chloroplastic isoform X2 [Castanea sativa]
MLSLRLCCSHSLVTSKPLIGFVEKLSLSSRRNVSHSSSRNLCFCVKRPIEPNGYASYQNRTPHDSALSGMEEVLGSYVFGKKKATEVAHLVWKHVVQKGDTVIDATCGNGYDTLAMVKMVADESARGCVYAMDIQNGALENASSLLEESLNPNEKGLVKFLPMCHSKMDKVVPEASVRLVAFNLGYLPGGDKTIITKPETTLPALEAAKGILMPGGLISLVVYVGHPGG